jgi:uncharacterized RDD family membrane protein YckC
MYAGFWRRVAAALIDGIVVGVVSFVVGLAWGLALGDSDASILVVQLLILVGYYVYFAAMESSSYQGTVGKIAIGIQVTDLNGNRVSFRRALGRNLLKILSTLILLIGYLLAAFTERKQALHDMIAGTLVVKREAQPVTQPAETTV